MSIWMFLLRFVAWLCLVTNGASLVVDVASIIIAVAEGRPDAVAVLNEASVVAALFVGASLAVLVDARKVAA